MIANPVKSTYNRCTARLIPRSWLLERCGEQGDYVIRGGRLLSVPSRNRRRSGDCCCRSRDRWFKLPFAPQIGHGSQLPPVRVTCSRTLLGAWQPWPVIASPTRPWEVIGFEELLSEFIARARMLRPHLGSRLVSALLPYGVRCRTLSCEERCGRMIANPAVAVLRARIQQ